MFYKYFVFFQQGGCVYRGCLQYISQIVLQQIICLDFAGELTRYNGEVLTIFMENITMGFRPALRCIL